LRDAPAAAEDHWQERVISHMRLDDWLRIDHGGELDCVGPVAPRSWRGTACCGR
jgi:hypothetical protein